MADGATLAMVKYIRNNTLLSDCTIGCRFAVKPPEDINVVEIGTPKEMATLLKEGNFTIVHYFKTSGYDLFNWLTAAMRRLGRRLPVVTTICQKPSYPTLLPSASELTRSDRVVMIDRVAMNDPLLSFVPDDRKACVPFGVSDTEIELTGRLAASYVPDPERVTFGRGSTPGKVPPDYCQVTDAIRYPHKHVVIAGIPADHPVRQQASGREYVEMVEPRPYKEWLELCNSFDVFLYYLPTEGHSSLDGALGQAMMLEKPVVFYGPAAPASRLEHGVNAFVANDPSELAEYCDRLAADPGLRRRMGKEGRRATLRDFSASSTVKSYNRIYSQLSGNTAPGDRFSVPLGYRMHFARHSGKEWLRSRLGGTWIERLHHKIKPLPERT